MNYFLLKQRSINLNNILVVIRCQILSFQVDWLRCVPVITPINQTECFCLCKDVVHLVLEGQWVTMCEVKLNKLEVVFLLRCVVKVTHVLDEEVAAFELRILLADLFLLSVPGERTNHATSLNIVLILLHLIHIDATLETEES